MYSFINQFWCWFQCQGPCQCQRDSSSLEALALFFFCIDLHKWHRVSPWVKYSATLWLYDTNTHTPAHPSSPPLGQQGKDNKFLTFDLMPLSNQNAPLCSLFEACHSWERGSHGWMKRPFQPQVWSFNLSLTENSYQNSIKHSPPLNILRLRSKCRIAKKCSPLYLRSGDKI